jgi:hypothetical protein
MKVLKNAILSSIFLALAGFILLAPGTATTSAKTQPVTTSYSLAQNSNVRDKRQEGQETKRQVKKGVRRVKILQKG